MTIIKNATLEQCSRGGIFLFDLFDIFDLLRFHLLDDHFEVFR